MDKIDAAHEEAMRRICEEADARALRDGLAYADEASRRTLLMALDWDSTKMNTKKLRRVVRQRICDGSISISDLLYYSQGR